MSHTPFPIDNTKKLHNLESMDYEFADDVSSYTMQEVYLEDKRSETHRAVASGYLYKLAREGSFAQVWHKRYYVLYSDGLMYSYQTDRSLRSSRTIPLGRMCLRMKFGAETVNDDCNSWPSKTAIEQRFSLINSDRSYHFYCDSNKEYEQWKHHLQQILSNLSSSSLVQFLDEPQSCTTAQQPNTLPPTAASHIDEQSEHSDADDTPYDTVYHSPIDVPGTDSETDIEERTIDSNTSMTIVHAEKNEVNDLLESLFAEITTIGV